MKDIAHTAASAFAASLLVLFVLVTGLAVVKADERTPSHPIASQVAPGWPVDVMNEQIDQTNFLVNGNCSGTLIDLANRYILTASHCVGAQYKTVETEEIGDDGTVTKKQVRIVIPGEVRQLIFAGPHIVQEAVYRTKLVAVDKDLDLALLQILSESIPNTVVSKIACEEPGRGDVAYAVGNPAGVLYSSVTVGIVSSIQRDYGMIGAATLGGGPVGDTPLMQISAGIIGGNSGGSVYNADGEIIGVPVLGSKANEVLGFAIPLDEIKTFLKAHGAGDLFAGCAATS